MIPKTLYSLVSSIIKEIIEVHGCDCLAIHCMPDHMHILIWWTPSAHIPDLIRSMKTKSSRALNESGELSERFEWQSGYGIFSVSTEVVPVVQNYIQNQEEIHSELTYKSEIISIK